VSEVIAEAERLLAVAPEEFVAERKALARSLRDDGRTDEAAAVEKLGKPSRVVFAVNRAARDRPKAARAAVDAAERVKELQLSGDPDAFAKALRELDDAVGLLADVAVAHVAEKGRSATESMRHRVRDLLRAAVADDDARAALARGALAEEIESPGFSPFAGMRAPTPSKARTKRGPTRAEKRDEERKAQAHELREELEHAEQALREATTAARGAERARARAEREVEALRKKLERLS
jgi:hypothetical protein